MPKTLLGQWSVGLIFGFFVFMVLFYFAVFLGQRGGETFFGNLWLTAPILLAGLSGVASFITGLVGIVKFRERNPGVFISASIGLLVLLWILAEIAFPH